MKKALKAVLILAMLATVLFCGAQFWAMDEEVKTEQNLHDEIQQHKPAVSGEAERLNPLEGLRGKNPDIVGWISVPYTNIDYPVVLTKDNAYYLRRDLNGSYAKAGTIFMDYRCAKDGGGYSILYGHNMKSGAMFGTLNRFEEKSFFEAHPEGTILFEDGWHRLQFFAFLVVKETDSGIYSVPQSPDALSDIAQRAMHYRALDVTSDDRIVALSTCAYDFQGARMVLMGKVV